MKGRPYKDDTERATGKKNQLNRQNKWISENRERLGCVFDKGTKERIESSGMSVSSFIKEAVMKELDSRGL